MSNQASHQTTTATATRQQNRGAKRCNMVQSLEDLKSPLFWRAVLAECLGTALLVFIGCGSTTGWGDDGYKPSIVQISVSFGFTLACLIWVLDGCSGCHVNPAVTMPLVLTRKISVVKGLLYMVGQCIGGIIGTALLKGVTPAMYSGTLGVSAIHSGMTPSQGFGVEFLLTFMLVITIFAMIDKARGQSLLAPLGIGLAATCTHLMGIKYTGCNLNPARSLGPALLSGVWHNHWIYWFGPLLGGITAGFLYDNVFASNASLRKTRDYMLMANYDNEKYDETKENYIPVKGEKDELEQAL